MAQEPNDPKQKNWTEELEVTGNELVDKVKELIEEGNVRRLIIYKSDGDVLMEVPLTASVIAGGALLVFTPMLAALGAAAAFLTKVRIEVVRMSEEEVEKVKREAAADESGSKTRIDIE